MTPQTQAILNDPAAGIRGDCYRTVIACLLDVPRDEVPHVLMDDTVAIRAATNMYLELHGAVMMEMPLFQPTLADSIAFMGNVNPGVSYLLSGTTPRGWDHSVVVHEGNIWDVHPSRDGLTGPCGDGFWWVGVLVSRGRA